MTPTITDAIKALHPTVNFSIDKGKIVAWDISEIKNNIPEPKQADIDAKLVELLAEYDANQYQRDRQYPSIGDQLDMQYHDQIDGTTTWKDAIAKVKSDNPKE